MPLLASLVAYSFFSQFLPIEPYLVPYFISNKHFTNYEVSVEIFPLSVYGTLIFTMLTAPACTILSYRTVIILGTFVTFLAYIMAWFGKSLIEMQIMQVTYGLGMASRVVFSSYIFLLAPEHDYQMLASITTTLSLFSFLLASELSQLLATWRVCYAIYFLCTVASLGICCIVTFSLPKDPPSMRFLKPSLATLFGSYEGFCKVLEETWKGRSIKFFSLWWAVSYAGFSMVQNYGTNLFNAIDPSSTYNGNIIGASQAVACLGSLSAIYIEQYAAKLGFLTYIVGSGIMGALCFVMGIYDKIWVAYTLFVVMSGIYQIFVCLIYVQCGRLLSNGQYILLFSLNNFAGLLIAAILQAIIEIFGLSIANQFVSFGVFFLFLTVIFATVCGLNYCKTRTVVFSPVEGGLIVDEGSYGGYEPLDTVTT